MKKQTFSLIITAIIGCFLFSPSVCIFALACMSATPGFAATAKTTAQAGKAGVSLTEIQKLRKEAAHRKRRIVFHSDGRPMDSDKMVFPHTIGTQVDSYTYSLIHQFNLARYYRTKVAQQTSEGDHLNHLDKYIEFCHKNNADAIWAMRMNDTHDAGDAARYRERFKNNQFKQQYPEALTGTRENKPYHGGWSAVDYAHPKVRERAYLTWKEVCQNYDIDGLLLDFFRHPTFFKTTAWGKNATEKEIEMMTNLMRKTRKMADEVGSKKGKPILIIARTPDSPGLCRGLGIDFEQWMKEGLIDIWLSTGYFRMQEWEDSVQLGKKYGIPVWASFDESRVPPTKIHNSPSAYCARAMNAWRAGIDAIYLFNFFYMPPDPHMELFNQLGDIETLKYTEKVYYPDPRGRYGWPRNAEKWLKGGKSYYTQPSVFSPLNPFPLKANKPQNVNLKFGDNLSSTAADGYNIADLRLTLIANGLSSCDDIVLKLNGKQLDNCVFSAETPKRYEKGQKLDYEQLSPKLVKSGQNQVQIALADTTNSEVNLIDISITVKYELVKK